MMNKVLFSIIIPVYNGELYVERCLNSLLKQTYSNWEAIIVDNYSEDTTEKICCSYKDQRIKYFKFHNHGVIASSRNFGIRKATGNWICFLDIDDWWVNTKLQKVYEKTTEYEFVYHHLYLYYSEGESFLRKKVSKCYPVKTKEPIGEMLSMGNPIQTSSVSIKKEKIKEFDVDPKLSGIEDFDLWLQLFKDGISHILIKEPLGFYNVGNTFSRNFTQILRERALLSKWFPQLKRKERRQALLCHFYHSGCLYYEKRRYVLAIRLWQKSFYSKSKRIKICSISGIIKAMVRSII